MSETEWMNIFGDNLAKMLKDSNMTQRELADSAYISESAISQYVSKQRVPNLKAIINIAYVLDCNVNDLIDFGDSIE